MDTACAGECALDFCRKKNFQISFNQPVNCRMFFFFSFVTDMPINRVVLACVVFQPKWMEAMEKEKELTHSS